MHHFLGRLIEHVLFTWARDNYRLMELDAAPFALLRLGVLKLGLVAYKLLVHCCSSSVLVICRRVGTSSPRRSVRMGWGRARQWWLFLGQDIYM